MGFLKLFKSDPESPDILQARLTVASAEGAHRHRVNEAKAKLKHSETAYVGSKVDTFKGNKLTTTTLNVKPAHGVEAAVDTTGNSYSNARLSVTRLALLGPLALAAPKRKTVDNRELYLNIIDGRGAVNVIKCDPEKEGDAARQFAAKVSTVGRQAVDAEALRILGLAFAQAKADLNAAESDIAERETARAVLTTLLDQRKADGVAAKDSAKLAKHTAKEKAKAAKALTKGDSHLS